MRPSSALKRASLSRWSAVPCRIEIRTRDGKIHTASVDYPRDHVKNPMTDAKVKAKFQTLAGRVLSADRVENALRTVWALDDARRVDAVLDEICLEP